MKLFLAVTVACLVSFSIVADSAFSQGFFYIDGVIGPTDLKGVVGPTDFKGIIGPTDFKGVIGPID